MGSAKKGTFSCGLCGSTFISKEGLRRHASIHNGDKPYSCPFCPSRFRVSYSLTLHVRTHTGEKPYECDVCGATFTQRPNLNTHLKAHAKRTSSGRRRLPRTRKPVHSSVSSDNDNNDNGNDSDDYDCQENINAVSEQLTNASAFDQVQVKFFPCSFCPERFPSEVLVLGHVEVTHSFEAFVQREKDEVSQRISSLHDSPDVTPTNPSPLSSVDKFNLFSPNFSFTQQPQVYQVDSNNVPSHRNSNDREPSRRNNSDKDSQLDSVTSLPRFDFERSNGFSRNNPNQNEKRQSTLFSNQQLMAPVEQISASFRASLSPQYFPVVVPSQWREDALKFDTHNQHLQNQNHHYHRQQQSPQHHQPQRYLESNHFTAVANMSCYNDQYKQQYQHHPSSPPLTHRSPHLHNSSSPQPVSPQLSHLPPLSMVVVEQKIQQDQGRGPLTLPPISFLFDSVSSAFR